MEEAKKEAIKKEAQEILKKFAASLEKVKFKEKEEKKELGGFRKEGAGRETSQASADFRKRMFENAPNKDEDCIIAEKKEWE